MSVEHQMYQAAVELVERRYPTDWGGAASVRLATGEIITSVAPDDDFDALSLCMEVGGFLEAHKQNQAVTHSLCLYRETETSSFKLLTPCGICQERLRFWGEDVLVAVTTPENALLFKPLRDLQNFHWSTAYR
ncbi:cytidine deaminase [Gymnodinialimonas sp. 2305UL16-5]|uniref:cytidine deaminase n=1 Tax=Gymnodinialimonas mytili TaxID=3126503 RepID=UPI0030A20015